MASKISCGSSAGDDDDDNFDNEDPQTLEDFAAFQKWLDAQNGGGPKEDQHPSAVPEGSSSSLPETKEKDPAAAVPAQPAGPLPPQDVCGKCGKCGKEPAKCILFGENGSVAFCSSEILGL